MALEISNLANKNKRRNYEIEDLSKPSEKERQEGLRRAQDMINRQVGKKTEAAYVSNYLFTTGFNFYDIQVST